MTSSHAEQSGRERILARAVWPVSVLPSIAMSSYTSGQISVVASARPTRNAMTAREAQFTRQRMVEDDPAPNIAIVDGVSFPEHGPIPWAPGIQSLPTEWTQAWTVSNCTIGQTHRRYRANRMVRSDTRAEETA